LALKKKSVLKKQRSKTRSRICKLLCDRTIHKRGRVGGDPRCNSHCKFGISKPARQISVSSKLVEITYSITTRRVPTLPQARVRRVERDSPGTASCVPRVRFLAASGPAELPRKSKRKEITFGTDCLHYCPREIFFFFFSL